jgi:hypothetical protein
VQFSVGSSSLKIFENHEQKPRLEGTATLNMLDDPMANFILISVHPCQRWVA